MATGYERLFLLQLCRMHDTPRVRVYGEGEPLLLPQKYMRFAICCRIPTAVAAVATELATKLVAALVSATQQLQQLAAIGTAAAAAAAVASHPTVAARNAHPR